MIVIATHEGRDYICPLLESWNLYGTNGHDIAVVETGGSSQEYLDHLNDISLWQWKFNLSISRTPYKGYDTGAYLWAYNTFHYEQEFLFMHDSMLVKRHDVMHDFSFIASAGACGCVPWLVFRQNGYDNQEQVEFVSRFADDPTLPGFGIFGPIFYAERDALDRLDRRLLDGVTPTEKNHQMAMERGWAVAFARADVKVQSLDDDFDPSRLVGDQYSAFKKYLPYRL